MERDQAKPNPSPEELQILTVLGRLNRMVQGGMTPLDAARKLLDQESSAAYLERNRQAMDALEKRILSPEYLARIEAAINEPDPSKKAELLADLKRENFAAIDMQAVHRTIAARNRQWKAEGILPPNASV